jgi:signal recognition particle subunit SRP54
LVCFSPGIGRGLRFFFSFFLEILKSKKKKKQKNQTIKTNKHPRPSGHDDSLQGSGKTTTCAKLAFHYQRRSFKTALVCADTFRAGAFDQLKQSALAAKIPFYGSYTETDPVKIARDGVRKFLDERFEVIIVDTSGRHRQEADLFLEMEQVHEAVSPDTTVFVMDSSIGQAAHDQASAFASSVDVGAVILTKMDGHAKGGGALSAVAATQSPIMFIGTGEHREDLMPFKPKSFVSQLLGMGDVEGLVDKLEALGDMKDQEAKMRKLIAKKSFNLRDLREQYQNILKLGPISNLMSMLPGNLSEMFGGKATDAMATSKFRAFLVTMDSMTDKELDGLAPLTESRRRRICRGAGQPPQIIDEMLGTLKQFGQVAGGMGRLDKAMNSRKGITPDALNGMLPPELMRQMGGTQGLAQMMKQMGGAMGGGGGGGMPPGMPPGFDQFAKMFGGGGM